MRPSTVIVAALATLSSTVSARACTNGLNYCGYNLLAIGKYRAEIEQELYNKNVNGDENHINNSVFQCSHDGWIVWKDFCSTGCRNAGVGASDHC